MEADINEKCGTTRADVSNQKYPVLGFALFPEVLTSPFPVDPL